MKGEKMSEIISKDVTFNYDRKGDVLYITFNPNEECITKELTGGVLLRHSIKTNRLVGITILDVSEIFV
jgi:uncharacterized protein YuzE